MAEEQKPSLHVDTDWKKQAQEEKKRLAEQEAQRRASAAGPAGVVSGTAAAVAAAPTAGAKAAPGRSGGRQAGEMPPASLGTLVQSIVTQALFYMGELAARGNEPIVNLDMARHHIDTLAVIAEKTKNNLSEDEKKMLDAALYETRMRFISIASQYAQLP